MSLSLKLEFMNTAQSGDLVSAKLDILTLSRLFN
jgi:hypothetical protein